MFGDELEIDADCLKAAWRGCLIVLIICGGLLGLVLVSRADAGHWLCDSIEDVSIYKDVTMPKYIGGKEGYEGLPYGLETVPFLLPITEDRAESYYLAFSQSKQTLYIWPMPDDVTDDKGGVHSACPLIAVHFDGVQ